MFNRIWECQSVTMTRIKKNNYSDFWQRLKWPKAEMFNIWTTNQCPLTFSCPERFELGPGIPGSIDRRWISENRTKVVFVFLIPSIWTIQYGPYWKVHRLWTIVYGSKWTIVYGSYYTVHFQEDGKLEDWDLETRLERLMTDRVLLVRELMPWVSIILT